MATLLSKLDAREPIRVLVTGAAGQIAYSLLFLIARGELLGKEQPVILHLLEVEAALPKLAAIVMELEDCASPLLRSVLTTSSDAAAFAGVDVALLVGARPRGPGMERKDLLAANAAIFERAGALLGSVASADVKVLVVGNPANTNALLAARAAPALPRANFTALTRLDANRARAALARRCAVGVGEVRGVTIWGNHSTSQFADASAATVAGAPAASRVADDAWLRGDFTAFVQNRGKAVIDARGASSAASAANAIVDHVHDWLLGSAGAPVSMGIVTTEAVVALGYCTSPGLVFSHPVVCQRGGAFAVVAGLAVDAFARSMLTATEAELLEERALATAPKEAAAAASS